MKVIFFLHVSVDLCILGNILVSLVFTFFIQVYEKWRSVITLAHFWPSFKAVSCIRDAAGKLKETKGGSLKPKNSVCTWERICTWQTMVSDQVWCPLLYQNARDVLLGCGQRGSAFLQAEAGMFFLCEGFSSNLIIS